MIFCNMILLRLVFISFLNLIIVIGKMKKDESLIYILLWVHPSFSPTWSEEIWQLYFYNKQCEYKNCFITSDYTYFNDVSDFDVIIFNTWSLFYSGQPVLRNESQIYILFSEESPSVCPLPEKYSDSFFNLTWTYKLDSDISLKFLLVKDKFGSTVGPKEEMHWISLKYMEPVSDDVLLKLGNKNKAAVWFASHCTTPSTREKFIHNLSVELKQYNLTVDVYGDCGDLVCPIRNEECHALVESDYYFYLAFENSFCEDYVTEKVLTATKHYAVPIVYGGANYSRFLPPGSYIDAHTLGPKKLARYMSDVISDKNKYFDYFRWHNHYSFHAPEESAKTDEVCGFCAFLNDDNIKNSQSEYKNMAAFWSCNLEMTDN